MDLEAHVFYQECRTGRDLLGLLSHWFHSQMLSSDSRPKFTHIEKLALGFLNAQYSQDEVVSEDSESILLHLSAALNSTMQALGIETESAIVTLSQRL